jgi:hypothetical protein
LASFLEGQRLKEALMPWLPSKHFEPETGWKKPRYEVFTWPVLTGVKPPFPEAPTVEVSDEIARAAEEASLRAVIDNAVAEQAHRYDPAWIAAWDEIAAAYADRVRQLELASRDRPDALQELILKELRKNPKATAKEVLQALEKEKRRGVIEDIVDGVVEWTGPNGRCAETSTNNLAKRVSRARKKLKNSR